MAEPARKLAAYEDLLALPDGSIGELLDGELSVQPRPTGPHALVLSAIGGELFGPFQRGRGGPGGWWILDEPELHLGDSVLVPDIAGWRRETMPSIPTTHVFSVVPDWVCEVLSPTTAVRDRMVKLRIYARERVGHAWLVDPAARTLEVFRRSEWGWILVGVWADQAVVRAEPFQAVELELSALWVPSE